MPDNVIAGWDIGGAHLKAALVTTEGEVCTTTQLPCPLWQGLNHLDAALKQTLHQFNAFPLVHAITMTGELTDLFKNREEGVASILSTMTNICSPEHMLAYAGRAGFVDYGAALQCSLEVASANWLACAELVSQTIPAGLFVDIGSTTTDIIPFADSAILAQSVTDRQRMINGELVYTGVTRTPLIAVAEKAVLAGEQVPLMAEFFATTADIYRILGQLPQQADQYPAADGAGKTVAQSMRRLARIVAADKEEYPEQEWCLLAEYFSRQQTQKILQACQRVLSSSGLPTDAPLIAAGVGRFLLPEIARQLQRCCIDFADLQDFNYSRGEFDTADCAPAVAVALLAVEKVRAS